MLPALTLWTCSKKTKVKQLEPRPWTISPTSHTDNWHTQVISNLHHRPPSSTPCLETCPGRVLREYGWPLSSGISPQAQNTCSAQIDKPDCDFLVEIGKCLDMQVEAAGPHGLLLFSTHPVTLATTSSPGYKRKQSTTCHCLQEGERRKNRPGVKRPGFLPVLCWPLAGCPNKSPHPCTSSVQDKRLEALWMV
jgi:hypothetical protein